jgi:hypothetical protein
VATQAGRTKPSQTHPSRTDPDRAGPDRTERIQKIVARVKVGQHRMASSDDPLFLRLCGPYGREFRLALAAGRSLRRDAEDVYVLGPPGASDTNVAHAELNDPATPPVDARGIEFVSLRKGMEPIPNVRGFAEMDDRLQIAWAEVEVHAAGRPKAIRFRREGPIWLGLNCGLSVDLPRLDETS